VGEFSVIHLLVLAVILLVIFGPSRLPGLGQSLGKAIRGFKDGLSETTNDINQPAANQKQQIPPVQTTGTENVSVKEKKES